ncbi:MAG: cyclase family protein [Streptosporangiales bacterium]|nr:cyclase family protein [Streptosporangiales bacterium]
MRIRKIVDLSHPVDAGTQVYPGDPVPRFAAASTIERDGYNLLHVSMGSQSGTHCDAPYHFAPDGAGIDRMELALFAGPAVVVDIPEPAPRHRITWEEIAPVADRLGEGVVVLLRTGWSRRYGGDAYFDHPFLDAEACRRILRTGVRTICLDTINIDETPDDDHPGEGFPVHRLVAAANGVIGENFAHLDRIDFPDPFVAFFPIKLTGADGAPVRAVAMQLEV